MREKKKKEGSGDRDRTMCVEEIVQEKKKKKQTNKRMDEIKREKGEII